jgi:glycerol kinase
MNYIIAIDQGTTGTTACLLDADKFEFIGKVNREYPQIYPKPSWVEHNLNDIWQTVEVTITELLKKFNVDVKKIISIGITNQRETTCAFNRQGTPLTNAIVWQDRRTHDFCAQLREQGLTEKIKIKTGLKIDPYFSSTKMHWMLNNLSQVKDAQKKGDLLFGTIDTFLLYKLTGGTSYKTDASNASRTMLMNIQEGKWDDELLKIFGVDKSNLPSIENSFGRFGTTSKLAFLPDGIPITGILGDQQSALFGQAGFHKGEMKCTYGTGAFVVLNTGDKMIHSDSGLLTTIEYQHKNKICYALEGSSYIAGAAVQWVRDNLKLIGKSSEIETLARQIKNLDETANIMLFPFFTGIGSPHWNAEAKAALIGLTRDSGAPHIARATLEGIAFSINDLIRAFRKDTGLAIPELKVDGGAVENNLLMEIQASVSNTKIVRPKIIETTAFGAALAAAIGAEITDMDSLKNIWKKEKDFSSDSQSESYLKEKQKLWDKTLNSFYQS